jgi:co-chaperonin GroES (HSP10)|tara:strand:- start:1692 stop:1949 length:258 start_codon:yes stop_codon:yes gene_type:complete
MKPIGKYIIIKTITEEVKTSSGLLLSQSDVDDFRYRKGSVVKTGTDVTVINALDLIYYDKNAGHTMMIDDNTYTIIQERDIVIVL